MRCPFALLPAAGLAAGITAAAPPPGERLDFDVSLGPFSRAASVRIETLSGSEDTRRLRAEVRTESTFDLIYPAHYVLHATAALPAWTPVRCARRVEQRGEASTLALRFDPDAGRVHLSRRAGEEPYASAAILPETRDLLTALCLVRARPEAAILETTVWEDGLYRVRIERLEAEDLEVPAGRFAALAYRVDARPAQGEAEVRDVRLWLSADPRRLPLQLRAETLLGTLTARLVAHHGAEPDRPGPPGPAPRR
jgi:hypothetical protein